MGLISRFLASKKGAQGITAMGVASAGIDTYSTYYFDQQENPEHSKGYSMAKGVGTGAAWLLAEPLMWGITLGQMAGTGAKMMYEDAKQQDQLQKDIEMHVRKDATGSNGGTLGGTFYDTQQAYTMRQRQMDLLRSHRISTESILGSEARQLHR